MNVDLKEKQILGGDPPVDARGAYLRGDSAFRDWVTADGSSGFKAEAGRYHLYVALNCPWAHRTVILRMLKRLDSVISMSVVLPQRTEYGWAFGDEPGCTEDHANGFRYLVEAYRAARPGYDGRVTVPVLWDKQRRTIVNNESSEIIRMLNSAFDAFTPERADYYPAHLAATIDAVNALVFEKINNGVYRAGLARSQEAYDEAVKGVFEAFDTLEARLARQRYLAGPQLTEADWRLFPTLVRFEPAYYGAFKCNLRRLIDYPDLWAYTRELYQMPGIAETVNFDHIKRGYWRKSARNPEGIVPKGPEIDFMAPHDRRRLPAEPPARRPA